jgi:hypothetical protein
MQLWLMKNSAKNLSGATLMQSISAFPVTAANVSIPTEMYVLVVKNDTEIVGACRVYSLGQD